MIVLAALKYIAHRMIGDDDDTGDGDDRLKPSTRKSGKGASV